MVVAVCVEMVAVVGRCCVGRGLCDNGPCSCGNSSGCLQERRYIFSRGEVR